MLHLYLGGIEMDAWIEVGRTLFVAIIGALVGGSLTCIVQKGIQQKRWNKEKSDSLYIPLYHSLKLALKQVQRVNFATIKEWNNIRQRGEHY